MSPAEFLDAFLTSLTPAQQQKFYMADGAEQRRLFLTHCRYAEGKRALRRNLAVFYRGSCQINSTAYVAMEMLRKSMDRLVKECVARNARLQSITAEQRRQKALEDLRDAASRLDRESEDVRRLILVKRSEGPGNLGLIVRRALDEYFALRKKYNYQRELLERVSERPGRRD